MVGMKETSKAVYVSDETSSFYLSQIALKDLHLLLSDFSTSLSQIRSSTIANEMASCVCLHRTPVPTKPKTIPFKPIQANRHMLQQWLPDYFKCSTFNICPHQQLQTMEIKPDIEFITVGVQKRWQFIHQYLSPTIGKKRSWAKMSLKV